MPDQQDQHIQELIKLLQLLIQVSQGVITILSDRRPLNPHQVDIFLADATSVVPNDGRFPIPRGAAIYARYRTWATQGQGRPQSHESGQVLSARAFHKEMERRGNVRSKRNGIDVYASLALRESPRKVGAS